MEYNDLNSLKNLHRIFKYEIIENELELNNSLQNYFFSTKFLTFDFSKKYYILPLDRDENTPNILRLVISNPYDYELLDRLSHLLTQTSDKQVKFYLAKLDDIKSAIKKIERGELGEKELVGYNTVALNREIEQNVTGSMDIISFVGQIILKAYSENASDIHIEPYENRVEIRFRVYGILIDGLNNILPKEKHNELVARIKILADMDISEKRRPQDARIKSNKVLEHLDKKVSFDLRVSTFPTVHGEKVVMRLLDKNMLKDELEELKMSENVQKILKEKIIASQGFILISGPTGSGKTTTLYSALASIDKNTKNILTIEDPVEYQLEGIHQMQVNSKIGVTFASGLRTALRQDPDVIMVGEIRDEETAQIAIQASLTGHLVFSTIHTNDALGIITRLLEMNVKGYLIADSITLAMAQRLVRKICPVCKSTKYVEKFLKDLAIYRIPTIEELENLLGFNLDELEYYGRYPYGTGQDEHGNICKTCNGSGYSGRVGIYSYVNINRDLKELLLQKIPTREEIEKVLKNRDKHSLLDSAKEKLRLKVTTIEEVLRVLVER